MVSRIYSKAGMKVNFKMEEGYAVDYNGEHIDLHNCFDFVGITEDTARDELKMEWKKTIGDWVREDEYDSLTFVFKNISYKYIDEGNEYDVPENKSGMSEISVFPSTERDVNDCFIFKAVPGEEDDMMFDFVNGKVIRICCEVVELIPIKG